MNDNNSNGSQRPIWFYVLVVVLAVGFGVPVLNFIGSLSSSLFSILILVIIALLLISLLRRSDSKKLTSGGFDIETCSDIRSLDINLGAGMFVIEQGESFKMDGNLKSSVENGVWTVFGNITDNISEPKITTITVPHYFTAEKASIKLGAGNLLIKALSAYEMSLDVSVGNMEAMGLYSKNIDLKCGVGRMKADASLHGDVTINCGMGETSLHLTNRSEEFNIKASVGLGKVFAGGREINGSGQNCTDNGAPYNMNIKCGMGSVRIDFGGIA